MHQERLRGADEIFSSFFNHDPFLALTDGSELQRHGTRDRGQGRSHDQDFGGSMDLMMAHNPFDSINSMMRNMHNMMGNLSHQMVGSQLRKSYMRITERSSSSKPALVNWLVPCAWPSSGALEVWRLGFRLNQMTAINTSIHYKWNIFPDLVMNVFCARYGWGIVSGLSELCFCLIIFLRLVDDISRSKEWIVELKTERISCVSFCWLCSSCFHCLLVFVSLLQNEMQGDPNGDFYSQSSVMSYSNIGNGQPKVYQATTATRQMPGGVSTYTRILCILPYVQKDWLKLSKKILYYGLVLVSNSYGVIIQILSSLRLGFGVPSFMPCALNTTQ